MRAQRPPHPAPPRRPSPPRTPPDAATAAAAGAACGVVRRRHRVEVYLAASPAPSRRATTAACATPSCRFSAASISPGSIRKPRSFTCASARPRKSSTPSLPPARQVAGAVHPAARRPERVGHEPLRRQPRTPQIAPRQTQHPQRTTRRSHQPEQDADRHPGRKPACSRSDGRSAERLASCSGSLMVAQTVVSVGPYALNSRRPVPQSGMSSGDIASPATMSVSSGRSAGMSARSAGGSVACVTC